MSNNEIDQAIREKRLYFVGDKLPTDWYEAFRLWRPIAESGDAKAQFNIARCYQRGDGIDKDKSKALEWYMRAVSQGEPRAHYNLHLFYDDNNDPAKASEWLAKATELGEPRALCDSAANFLSSGDKDKARQLYQLAVDKGYDNGELGLIACNINISIEQNDTTEHYTYTASNASGGGTRGGSYKVPTIVFKVQNQSPQTAIMSLWIAKYDYANSNQKIGDAKRLDLPALQSSEVSEVREKIFSADEKPVRVYLTGYTLWRVRDEVSNDYLYIPLREKVLAWEWQKKKGCFVLTACYGDYDAPTVLKYRQFRDQHLSQTRYGQKFISWYYTHGPKWAGKLENMPLSKAILRVLFRLLSHMLPR